MTAPGDREDAPKGFFDEFFGAFGTFPYEWVEKDGKLVYGFTDPGTKEALALLAGWYAEELIDPEWVTEIARKDGENDVSWKFANDKIGYVSTLGAGDNQWDGNGHLNRKWAQFREDQWPYIWTQKCRPEPGCEAEMWLHEHLGFKEIDASAHPGYHPYVNGEPRSDRGVTPACRFAVWSRLHRLRATSRTGATEVHPPPAGPRRDRIGPRRLLRSRKRQAGVSGLRELGMDRVDKGPLFRYNQWTPYRLQNIDNYFGDYSGGNSMNPFWGFHWWYEPANGPARTPADADGGTHSLLGDRRAALEAPAAVGGRVRGPGQILERALLSRDPGAAERRGLGLGRCDVAEQRWRRPHARGKTRCLPA